MPSNVRIYNLSGASTGSDTFTVVDNVPPGGSFQVTVQGSQYSSPFNCNADDQGYGDLDITNVQSGVANHFSFVRDNQDISM
jgi:hypothetical protein